MSTDTSAWRCKGCGCTERRACPPTCWWVGPQLCSTCASPKQHYIHKVAVQLGKVDQLFSGQFKLPKEFGLKVKGREDMKESTRHRRIYGRSKASDPSATGHYKGARKLDKRSDPRKILTLIPKGRWRSLTDLMQATQRQRSTLRNALRKLVKLKQLKVKVGVRPYGARGTAPNLYGR